MTKAMQINPPLIQRKYSFVIALIALAAFSLPLYNRLLSQSQTTDSVEPAVQGRLNTAPALPSTVAALGRIIPKNGVLNLSGSSSLAETRVIELNVNEGDEVAQGQILALLDPFYSQQATVLKEQQRVAIAQAELEQVLAGESKLGDHVAQEATIAILEAQLRTEVIETQALIARMQSELENAERTYKRFQDLYNAGAISISDLESTQEQFEIAQAQLDQSNAQLANIQATKTQQIRHERANLETLAEIRPVDVALAEAELRAAEAAVSEAQANLELTIVRAPIAGRVLTVHTRAGETIRLDGLLDLGQTQDMYVLAEVYETDVTRLQTGQAATVNIDATTEPLQGTVEHIAPLIDQKRIFNNDPTLGIDARVFEVKIRLNPDDSPKVEQFIHMQADVTIQVAS